MITLSESQVLASVCRGSLADFVKEFWHIIVPEPLVWGWHLQYQCEVLQHAYERVFAGLAKEKDIVTNVPPGTTKSSLHSIMAHAWAWTRMPHCRIIGASYAYDIALDFSRKCRDVIRSELYQKCFPEITLRDDQDTKQYFVNTRGGDRYAVGSRGSVMGKHAHIITLDDPVDPKGAESDAELYAINNWIEHELNDRKVDKLVSLMDLVMQRVHQDDPSSRMGPRSFWIRMPATTDYRITPPELINNYQGGLLDPGRLSRTVLEEKAQVLGPYAMAGQYGQDPVPSGGGLFRTEMIRWGRPPGKYKYICRAWDKAAVAAHNNKAKRAAWTAGVQEAEDYEGRIWVLDVRRGRWDPAARERRIKRTAMMDTRQCIIALEQEGGSAGKDAVLQAVKRLRGFRVKVMTASGSKELRAEEFAVQVNNGNVYLPENLRQGTSWIGWAKDFIDELRHWPFSSFLDQGDAAGLAYTVIVKGRVRIGPLRRRNAATETHSRF